MIPQELKNSILQMAIQGKLVEQRPEEGTGEELYRQIQEEKQRLIKAGKIKKEKLLPEIAEDEKPFEIPESWKWVRLGDFTSYSQTKEKKRATDITPEIWSLDLEDIEKETGKILNICSASERKIVGDKVKFYKGQILYSKLRPYLKKILIAPDDGICSSEMVPFHPYGNINCNYLVYVLKSPHIDFTIDSATYGVKMPRVGTETMINLLIPLPPFDEQKRIVAKIEKLLPYIDRYEQAWNRLEGFNQRFPNDMKKSILQMAIQGKLVEQRPEEGTAEELYQQIQAEKQRLIKSEKIKKEKPLPEITEDEVPFDIPENWVWARFGELGSYKKGPFGSALTKSIFVTKGNDSVKVYEQKNAIHKNAELGEYYITREYFESKMKGFEVCPGDIIVSCAGTIGETYVMPKNIEQGIINQALMRMKLFEPIYIPYFLVFFDFVLKKNARSSSKGSAIKNIPPFEILKNYLVPLPPRNEQKRIVAKLEELLTLCEQINYNCK